MSRALQSIVLTAAGWLDSRQQVVIGYLLEENRVQREQLGDKRLRFTDAQRRQRKPPTRFGGVRASAGS